MPLQEDLAELELTVARRSQAARTGSMRSAGFSNGCRSPLRPWEVGAPWMFWRSLAVWSLVRTTLLRMQSGVYS